jgi:hypothetical protein
MHSEPQGGLVSRIKYKEGREQDSLDYPNVLYV